MKMILVQLLLIVWIQVCKQKSHHKKKQVSFNNLPPTPKGPGLKKAKTRALTSEDPEKVKLYTVDYKGNYILQELEKKSLNNVKRFCNRVDNPHEAFCSKITQCDICTMSYKCGWCESTNQCVSGNVLGSFCPDDCLQNWMFHTTQCKMTVKAGRLGNWAPDANGLINAEQIDNAGKSVRVNTYEPNYFVRESQVQIGVTKKKDVNAKINVKYDGQNEREETISTTPLFGKQVIRVPLLNQKLNSKLINIQTGEEIPPVQKTEKKVFHGVNDGLSYAIHGSRL